MAKIETVFDGYTVGCQLIRRLNCFREIAVWAKFAYTAADGKVYIEILKKNMAWGSRVYQKISKDLVEELPEIKSFSPRNLQYMNQFYRLYSDIEITHQLETQIFKSEIAPQTGA